MCMWSKNIWALGVTFIFLFIFIVNIKQSCAEEIKIDYPEEVNINEEFYVLVNYGKISEYEVKIDILDSQGKRIAKIFNPSENKFKSTIYYIKPEKSDNNEGEVKIKMIIEKYVENADVIITLRDSKNKRTKFDGYKIYVKNQSKNKLNEDKEDKEENELEMKKDNLEEVKEENELKESDNITENSKELGFDERLDEQNVIYLTAKATKDIKTSENNKVLFKSANQKMKDGLIFFFILFCIFAFYIIKKESKKNV